MTANNTNNTNTAGRAKIAERMLINGTWRNSREFDNCFENNDGDQVVTILIHHSDNNVQLKTRIQSLGKTVYAEWQAVARKQDQPFDLFDPDTWPEPETPAENRQAAEAMIDEPEPVIIRTKAGPQYAFGALLASPDGTGTQMSLI